MQRFKTRPQFQAALSGTMVAKSTHFALHRSGLDLNARESGHKLFPASGTWIGAMVPKRWAKRAVTRNTIKRQIYTVSTCLEQAVEPAAFLIRLRRDFSRQVFLSASSAALKDAVRAELMALVQTASNVLATANVALSQKASS